MHSHCSTGLERKQKVNVDKYFFIPLRANHKQQIVFYLYPFLPLGQIMFEKILIFFQTKIVYKKLFIPGGDSDFFCNELMGRFDIEEKNLLDFKVTEWSSKYDVILPYFHQYIYASLNGKWLTNWMNF